MNDGILAAAAILIAVAVGVIGAMVAEMNISRDCKQFGESVVREWRVTCELEPKQ